MIFFLIFTKKAYWYLRSFPCISYDFGYPHTVPVKKKHFINFDQHLLTHFFRYCEMILTRILNQKTYKKMTILLHNYSQLTLDQRYDNAKICFPKKILNGCKNSFLLCYMVSELPIQFQLKNCTV